MQLDLGGSGGQHLEGSWGQHLEGRGLDLWEVHVLYDTNNSDDVEGESE